MIRKYSVAWVVIGACWSVGCSDDDSPNFETSHDSGAVDAGSSEETTSTTLDAAVSSNTTAATSEQTSSNTAETQTSEDTTPDASLPTSTTDTSSSTSTTDTSLPTSTDDGTTSSIVTTAESSSTSTAEVSTSVTNTTLESTSDVSSTVVTSDVSTDAGVADASDPTVEDADVVDTSETATSSPNTTVTLEPVTDAGVDDGGDASAVVEASVPDASAPDTSAPDASAPDASAPDASAPSAQDAAVADAAVDAGDAASFPTCADNPCGVNADCTDTMSGYECTCQSGYEGDGITCVQNCVLAATCVCGDGDTEGTEVCDDSNQTAGDGCRADCRGNEECGDGIVDSVTGEQCDDGNEVDSDACRNDCTLEPFVDRAAVLVSDVLSCSTATQNTGRKTATDGAGRLYVLMNCSNSLYVARSSDRGATWSLPIDTGLADVAEGAIEGGADGFAYVVAVTNSGDLNLTRTLDGGGTWETSRTLTTGVSDTEVSIDGSGNAVYIAVSAGSSNLSLFRNFALGTGTFETVDVALDNFYHDVAVDKISGNVIVMADDPSFYIRVSTDLGSTFAAAATPTGSAFYSDWTGSNGNLYVTGDGTSLYVIPMSTPGTSTAITGLPSSSDTRSIDTDAVGNAYIASILSPAVQLDRLVYNAGSVSNLDAVTIAASGEAASVSALPNNSGALVAFTESSGVWVAIEVY